MKEKMLTIAKNLVQVQSVNTTSGEKEIGEWIETYLRSIPYFKEHPEQVLVEPLKDDPLERRNVMALLIGEKEWSERTILLHGHTDTVGVEDYGILKEYACKPDELMEQLKQVRLPEEVKEDLDSGDYMFGRGACDMKSGDAVLIGLIEELSKKPETLKGNLLVSFNPVEENLHTGMIEGLDLLMKIKETYQLEYVMAINNDYICPLYPGDTKKTIYTGTVGKLLPCFYVQGKETHVGQCFEGFDASMVAAKLVEKISLNCDFSDEYEGEVTLPPSVLKIKDLKPWYNVQTAFEALVYFNYFVHNADMEEITGKLLDVAKEVMEETVEKINKESRRFARQSGQKAGVYQYTTQVYSYDQLCRKLIEEEIYKEEDLESDVNIIMKTAEEKGIDKREIPVEIIRHLLQKAHWNSPVIVLYYGAPYCPHNTLQGKDTWMIKKIEKIADRVSEKCNEEYRLMRFFPSLSDSSYLKLDDTEESIQNLVDNFPAFKDLYPVPLKKIKVLNIPAINYGCYGKDAHKWSERVHIPYTFEVLPELILETIHCFLEEEA